MFGTCASASIDPNAFSWWILFVILSSKGAGFNFHFENIQINYKLEALCNLKVRKKQQPANDVQVCILCIVRYKEGKCKWIAASNLCVFASFRIIFIF